MKAITLDDFGSVPTLRDQPAPAPGANEVLVRVQASSANPVDNAIAAGMLKDMVEHEFPVILGRDYAGTVEQVGADVTDYAAGDEIYGFVLHADPAIHAGSWSELITVAQDGPIAPAPAGVEPAVAGAAPLTGITAMTAVDALDIAAGDTVLVVGAAGGVGSFAVQLAAAVGATVVAPALAEDKDYLGGLGVDEVLPRDGDIAALVRERHPEGVDAVLDLVSYAPGAFDAALKDGGRVASPNGAAGEGPGRANVMAVPSRENLDRLATLLADGSLRVPITATYDLENAADALSALGTTHTRGKVGIRIV